MSDNDSDVSDDIKNLTITATPPPPPHILPCPPPPPPVLNLTQKISEPSIKFKHLNFLPITDSPEEGSLWADSEKTNSTIDLDKLKELFEVKRRPSVKDRIQKVEDSSPLPGRPGKSSDKKLLSHQRALNLRILLRQFNNPDDIIKIIKDCAPFLPHNIKLDAISSLIKQLPSDEEEREISKNLPIEHRQNYIQNCSNEMEKFFLEIIFIPDYRLRLLCLEFIGDLDKLDKQVQSTVQNYETATNSVTSSEGLRSVLHIVLECANYMKANKNQAKLQGIKIASLLDLLQTRSNKPGVTLLHYVINIVYDKIEKDGKDRLSWASDLEILESAVKTDFRQIEKDISEIIYRHKTLLQKIHETCKTENIDTSLKSLSMYSV